MNDYNNFLSDKKEALGGATAAKEEFDKPAKGKAFQSAKGDDPLVREMVTAFSLQ